MSGGNCQSIDILPTTANFGAPSTTTQAGKNNLWILVSLISLFSYEIIKAKKDLIWKNRLS